MGDNRDISVSKKLDNGFFIVDQHITGGGAQKQFYPAYGRGIYPGNLVPVFVCGAQVERIIYQGMFSPKQIFVFQVVKGHGLR